VIDLVATSDHALDGIEVAEVAEHDLHVEAGECAHIRVLAHQDADPIAARKQGAHYVAPYKSVCAGDER